MNERADGRRGLGPWQGRVFLSVGRALYLGTAGDTTPHAHHALQVSIGLDTPVRLRHGGGTWRECDGVVVAPDVTHQLDRGWGDLVLFYVEPESTDGRRWLRVAREPIRPVSTTIVSAVRATARRLASHPPTQANLDVVFAELMRSLGFAPDAAKPTDRRVEHAVRRLRAAPGTRDSMGELARAVGLSPSRLRHVFRREMGMSAQSYVVWLRIYEACAALADGASLSRAAAHAGFSDAAHFTRTFRRTFGLAPSQIANALTLTTVPHAG